jgi:hypothetical protein
MQAQMPDLSLRAELGMPERLTRFLVEGIVQAALMYTPQMRPGLLVEEALEDELVLVASYEGATVQDAEDYVFVEWGTEFSRAHAAALPHLTNSGLHMALGALAADYVMHRRAKAYLPARVVKRRLDSKRLHIVADAPRFPYPAWVVWREDLDTTLLDAARRALVEVAQDAETEQESMTGHLDSMADFQTGQQD